MAHDRDHDHPLPPSPPRDLRETLRSRRKPDGPHHEHPTPGPREPVDPRSHPNRWPRPFGARPA
jgi:hypothetical protein